jgi:hypothetical protein
VKGDGRKLYNEDGDSWFWPTPNTILVFKPQTLRLAKYEAYEAYIGVSEKLTGGLAVNLKRRSYWKTLA